MLARELVEVLCNLYLNSYIHTKLSESSRETTHDVFTMQQMQEHRGRIVNLS